MASFYFCLGKSNVVHWTLCKTCVEHMEKNKVRLSEFAFVFLK